MKFVITFFDSAQTFKKLLFFSLKRMYITTLCNLLYFVVLIGILKVTHSYLTYFVFSMRLGLSLLMNEKNKWRLNIYGFDKKKSLLIVHNAHFSISYFFHYMSSTINNDSKLFYPSVFLYEQGWSTSSGSVTGDNI